MTPPAATVAGEHWWALGAGPGRSRLTLLASEAKDAPLAAVIPLDATLPTRLEALLTLWRRLQGRATTGDPLTPLRRKRLASILRALDARREGAAYRDIAAGLYGPARVADEPWKTSSLRDTTLRLVRDGRVLVDGGYRTLLGGADGG